MQQRIILSSTALVFFLAACGGSEEGGAGTYPYNPDETRIVSVDGAETQSSGECVVLDNGLCPTPQEECGDNARADVIVADGEVLDVICYPVSDVPVESVPTEQVSEVANENNAVIALDGADDGVDVEGDVTIGGNNVVLYGGGPDVSVIGGTVNVEKNNAVISGVRIQGDVTIDKNNTSFVDCVIEGNVTIAMNNATIAGCTILGKLTVQGNNVVLVGNVFAQQPDLDGQNPGCESNRLFVDADEDLTADEDEIGDPIECPGNKIDTGGADMTDGR